MARIQHDSPKLDLILSALANEKRRAMIYELALSPATLSQLAGRQGMTLPALRKHTLMLEETGLIIRKKSGRLNFVALNASTLKVAQDYLLQFRTGWSSPHSTLDNYVSRMQE